jgi:hypothetical protein
VGYAESDNGIDWRKPTLGFVDYGPDATNLVDLAMHSPSVYIDPTAPASARYRACGMIGPGDLGANPAAARSGYYSAHSADGLHWTLDQTTPSAAGADTIKSIWHPGRERGIVAYKRNVHLRGIPRRSIYTSDLVDGRWSAPVLALAPDDFDDIAAQARGFASGDFYAMAMLPAGQGTVAFVEQFRHSLPRTRGNEAGVFGVTDTSLAYQSGPGDRWLHAAARKDFLTHEPGTFYAGGFYLSSTPVAAGDEMRLYFSAATQSHGWYVNNEWQIDEDRKRELIDRGLGQVGFASYTRDRLFGLRADPNGTVHLSLPAPTRPSRLRLNCQTTGGGSVRVEQRGVAGRGRDDALLIRGDQLAAVAAWQDGDQLAAGTPLQLTLHLDCATVGAWDLEDG